MSSEILKETLEEKSGHKLKIRINDNHSTMLSVRWEADHTKVSLHKMFLDAPGNVMDALACYINGKHKVASSEIRAFIDHHVKFLNHSNTVSKKRLETLGKIYDLKKFYHEINDEYFAGKLDLQITWYGQPSRKYRSSVTYGLYSDALKLVKIHRILDRFDVPDYVVRYVIYHEILHHVCPPEPNESGNATIHTKAFINAEKKFKEFKQAKNWIDENNDHYFMT